MWPGRAGGRLLNGIEDGRTPCPITGNAYAAETARKSGRLESAIDAFENSERGETHFAPKCAEFQS